jgi:O-antigen/teichoic acid export membrane protein
MSRSKRFVTGLLTGYASLGVNILYTLASVPLALHYLTKQEFGLWALITQLSGYLLLLEFGMSGSVARFLSDHKDDINGGEYGSVLNTGFRVFLIQGILVATLGFLAAKVGPTILALPALFIGIPIIWTPVFFVFIFGDFKSSAAGFLMAFSFVRLLENNLPLPAWIRPSRITYMLKPNPPGEPRSRINTHLNSKSVSSR